MTDLLQFFRDQADKIWQQTLTHVGLTFFSLLIALLIGLPLGCWISRRPKIASVVIGFTGVLQTVPSIALLGILIPVMGIGAKPAIFALFLYALLPIVRNTYVGIREVNPVLTDAARGMGMTGWQMLVRVELPLAIGFLYGVFAFASFFFTDWNASGWTSVIMGVLFIGGLQLVMLGIIGEYIGKLFMQAKQRPGYIVKKTSLGIRKDAPDAYTLETLDNDFI